jgi:hypothetical protein
MISSSSHHLHYTSPLALKYRLILHSYSLPWTGHKCSSVTEPSWLSLGICIHYDHLLLMLLYHTLQPITNNLGHMRLLTPKLLIIHACSSIEEINCLRIIMQVFILHTQIVQCNDHGSIDIFLISCKLKLITDRLLLIDEIRATIT